MALPWALPIAAGIALNYEERIVLQLRSQAKSN